MTYRDPRFIEMKKAGKSHREIGEAFGVNFRSVDRWACSAIKKGLITKMSGRAPTEPSIIERLKELWFSGLHIEKVAAELDKTVSSVRGLVVRYGFRREQIVQKPRVGTPDKLAEIDRLRKANLDDAKIAERFGVSALSVRRARIKHRIDPESIRPGHHTTSKTWTPEEEATLRRLWLSGLSCHLIGQQMGGRTSSQIASKGKRMKLPDKGSPRVRKVADRDYASVSVAASARKGTTLGPKARMGPKEDPNIIPDFARPWLTRGLGECAFPYGPRGQVHSCCKPVFGISKYCEAHHALCTTERRIAA